MSTCNAHFLVPFLFRTYAVFDIEANMFYDRNHKIYDDALLTRCYTQHALRPIIDSEINY